MIAMIRPSKTLLAAYVFCLLHAGLNAQDSAIMAIIKTNAVPPQFSFSDPDAVIKKIPAKRTGTVNSAQHPASIQAFQLPTAARAQTNIACPDSSFLKIFEANNRAFSFNISTKTNDGGIVIGGYGRDNTTGPPYSWYAVITKFDSIGNHIWSKELRSDVIPGRGLYIEGINELSDGSIIISGWHDNPLSTSPPTATVDFFVAKLTATGNLTWLKTFHSLMGNGCTTSNIRYASVAEGDNGDLYVGATISNCPDPRYTVVFKLNSGGNLVWQYNFTGHFATSYCMGVFYDGSYITVVARGDGSSLLSVSVDFVRLNAATGAYISHKSWEPDLPYPSNFYAGFLNWTPTIVRLNNGNYCLYGNTFGDLSNPFSANVPHFSILEFNNNYDFVKGYTINSTLPSNAYESKIKVDRKGRVIYGMSVQLSYPDEVKYYGIADNGVILHQRKKDIAGLEVFYDNAELFDDGSVVYINNLASSGQSNFYLYYSKMHVSDTGSLCLGFIDNFSTIAPVPYKPNSFIWTPPNPNALVATSNQNNSVVPLVYSAPPPCYQTSVCDTLKIHGNPNLCDVQQDLGFTAFKNIRCGARVNWSIDTTVVQSFQVINDTSVLIRFSQIWQGWLYASITTSCGEITDSVLIKIINSPGPVNIGPDTSICQANTLVVNAGKGYATYLWNTGVTDSLISVTSPGTYYVDVADSCGNSFSDTVLVSPASPILVSIGPDRTICRSDTLHIQAPSGFINYTWSPNYNISAINTQQVIITPAVDTSYIIMAEKTPGCFAYDTVHVTVHQSPPVNLGTDKSFCNGDSLVLDAGPGFMQYQWNNGSNTQQITVHTSGVFSVTGTTVDGCRSLDTLVVPNLYPLPVVSLSNDSVLCTGNQKILDAGWGFANYTWNTGSVAQSITINSPGVYSVTVTDNNGCKGADTTSISVMLPPPAGFLGPDTSMCLYDRMQLKPAVNFNQYTWSTGSSAPAIIINQPGNYWLQVKDANNCVGKDTLVVDSKNCPTAFFMPTGFTPNNDGRNDLLRPVLRGNIVQYKFRIYNRWGELILETTDPDKGWDGTHRGQVQSNAVFVWICVYQFDGEPAKTQKGTFVLIR
jgi:gliding motility-associated-like protein